MNIVVIDDDKLVALSLKTILESTGDIKVAAMGHSGEEAIALYRELDRDRKARAREGCFNIEGAKLCTEAVRAGLEITAAFVTETALRKYPDAVSEIGAVTEVTVITDRIL